jgi:hypothetical protein
VLSRSERTNLLLEAIQTDLRYVKSEQHTFESAQFSWFGIRTKAVDMAVRMVADQYYVPEDLKQTYGWIEQYDCRLVLLISYEKQRELLLRRKEKHPEKLSTFDRWLIDDPEFGAKFLEAYTDVVRYFRPMFLDVTDISRTQMVDQAIAMIAACQTATSIDSKKTARDQLTDIAKNNTAS